MNSRHQPRSLLRALSQLMVLATVLLSTVALAQEPVVQRIESSNLGPGRQATATVHGSQLAGALALWTPAGILRPVAGHDPAADQKVVFDGSLNGDVIPGIYPARVATNHGCSEAAWIVIDDLPSIPVTAEADDPRTGQLVALPACLEGQINPVQPKFVRCALSTGESCSLEVFARRIGSDLDPVIRVTGPDGHEIAYSDDIPAAEGDARLQFTASVAGEYRIELRDVRYSGGARHFFHLRVGQFPLITATAPRLAQPGFPVQLSNDSGQPFAGVMTPTTESADTELRPISIRPDWAAASGFASVAVTSLLVQQEVEPDNTRETATLIELGACAVCGAFSETSDVDWYRIAATQPAALLVTARTKELGSPCDVVVSLHAADGSQLGESDDAGLRDAELAAQLPTAGDYFLKVTELAGRGGSNWSYALDVFQGRKAVRVTMPVDRISVPRRGSAGMVLSLQRINADGPLRVEATGLPASMQMVPFVISTLQKDVPLVITAANATDTSTDDDWGPISVLVSAPDGSLPTAEVLLAPPPPKKQDADVFRSARLRTDLFAAVGPAAQFSLTSEPSAVSVTQGASATFLVKATRSADWTEPIEIALATPADQLPPGITVTGGSMTASELSVTITAAADATTGPFAVFLNGKSKKDKTEPIHPAPAIQIEVVAKVP